MRTLLTINDRIADFFGKVAGLLVLVIFLLIVAEVAGRKLFGYSARYTWEYIAYLTGAVVFLSLAHTQKSAGHIRLSFVSNALGAEGKRWIDLTSTAFAVLVIATVTWALSRYAFLSWSRGSLAATATRTPLFIPQAVLAFGSLLFLLQFIARFIRLLMNEQVDPERAVDESGE